MGNPKPLWETCMECQNGKTPTPAVGNMSAMSLHGNVVDMPSHGNVSGTWEFPQLGMQNMCGMCPVVGLGIHTLSLDMDVSRDERFTLDAFCNGSYAERVSVLLVW